LNFGAIEMGGTKVNCMVAHDLNSIKTEIQVPTTKPEETLQAILTFFKSYLPLKALGIGSFGPLDLDKDSVNYGAIQSTPKPNWSEINLYQFFKKELRCKVFIDTDVNVAGIAEHRLGAGKNLQNFIYTTIGTGIGSGLIMRGSPVYGLSHPEVGHIQLVRSSEDMEFIGSCPFHNDCVESLASGTAIKKRWGFSLDKVETTHQAWYLEAEYIAQFAYALTLTLSPQKLIFGGGVSSEILLEKVRDNLFLKVKKYIQHLQKRKSLDDYICLPAKGDKAGILGSLILAVEGNS
jgi:fructokinase